MFRFQFTSATYGLRRVVNVTVMPENSVWDASAEFQTTTTQDPGRGDFDVDGFRIFAYNRRQAEAIAQYLTANGWTPRGMA